MENENRIISPQEQKNEDARDQEHDKIQNHLVSVTEDEFVITRNTNVIVSDKTYLLNVIIYDEF